MPTPIITDGLQSRVVDSPRVVLPGGAMLFADRAARFDHLAAGHAMERFLRLLAEVSRGQAVLVDARRAPPLDAKALEASREYGMPPLTATSHRRDAAWRDDLRDLLDGLAGEEAAAIAAPVIARLRASDDASLELAADRLLAGTSRDDEAAEVPFLGAALQVYFARLAATVPLEAVSTSDVPTLCPVCAMRPVASVVRVDPQRANLRFLVCSTCQTEWNLPRIQCSSCETDKGVQYFQLDPQAGGTRNDAWRAEACDECRSYLKIFYQDKDLGLDPVADDLASLALDVLLDERGYARSGPNLLFHPGGG